jgi:hypothetical protein
VPAVLASRRGTGDLVSCREVGARGGAGRAAVVWRGKWNSAAAAAMAFLPGKTRDSGRVRHCFWQGNASTMSRTRRGLPYGVARPAGLHARRLARARPRTGRVAVLGRHAGRPGLLGAAYGPRGEAKETRMRGSIAEAPTRPYTGGIGGRRVARPATTSMARELLGCSFLFHLRRFKNA